MCLLMRIEPWPTVWSQPHVRLFFKICIYLALSGLSCGTHDLCCITWDLSCGALILWLWHRLSCFTACGIFPDQGLNLCPLHCKTDSFILLLFFKFTILYWFCHTSTCNCHGCTRVPHPEPPLPPLSPYHPSGSSQCTSPKLPVSCINPGLAFVSYILYMF